jgi:hypothetical protein
MHDKMNPVVEQFDITKLVGKLQAGGKWAGPPVVTILVRSGGLKGGSIQFGTISITSH